MADAPTPVASFGRSLHGRTTVRPVSAPDLATARGISRGAGCSYGDQAWCSGGVAWTAPGGIEVGTDRVDVGAGESLRDVLARLWPHDRTLAVLPGSLAVTVGGAIAADVHGKNHVGAGSFAGIVEQLVLATPTGTVELGPGDAAFHATLGGMGLTGTVLRARLATTPLQSRWAHVEHVPANGLHRLLDAFETALHDHDHVAAWVDLTAADVRGVVEAATIGVEGPAGATTPSVPVPPRLRVPRLPASVVRPWTIRAGNAVRFRRARATSRVLPVAAALFPLEAVDDFPRLYGPTGFVQHQVVVPPGRLDVLERLVAAHRDGPAVPALAVLKVLGAASDGHLSFPSPGWTLAVDLPAVAGLRRHLAALDRAVADAGGRVYLAKDATLDPDRVVAMYPRLDEWRRIADDLDPDHRVTSDLDRRLGLRRPREVGRA